MKSMHPKAPKQVGVYAAVAFALIAVACGQALAATLYVLTNNSRSNSTISNATTFATIDTVTGVYTPVQTLLSGTSYVKNLAYDVNNNAFYTSAGTALNSDLRTLTTAGVLSSQIGVIGKDPYAMWYNSSTGTLSIYNRTNQAPGTVNTTNAAFTQTTANAPPGNPSVDNLVSGRGASLGGVDYFINAKTTAANSSFGFLNLTSGSYTQIGSTNANFQYMVLASDGTSLYGLVPTTTGSAFLYTINTTDGSLSSPLTVTAASGTIGPQFSGASFAVVPEPSTIALAVSGIAILAAGMRSRRKSEVASAS
jgi:hypothetical protein